VPHYDRLRRRTPGDGRCAMLTGPGLSLAGVPIGPHPAGAR
jgi:hypothetical protein